MNPKKRPKIERPSLTRETQSVVWRLADALARALRQPNEDSPGDFRWTVTGVANSTWTINHPDLLIDSNTEPILQLRIKRISGNRWGVFGQNHLENLENTKVISIINSAPDNSWDIDGISQVAANYFQEQKADIDQLKQEMTPSAPPGSPTTPQQQGPGGGPPGLSTPPMSSRRASNSLPNLKKARLIVASLNTLHKNNPHYLHAQVLNDAQGIGVLVRTKSASIKIPPIIDRIPLTSILVTKPKDTLLRQAAKGRSFKPRRPDPDIRHRHLARRLLSLVQKPLPSDYHTLIPTVVSHLKSSSRLYSSIKGLAKALSRDPQDITRVVGHLVDGGFLNIDTGYLRLTNRIASINDWGPYKSSGPDTDPLQGRLINDPADMPAVDAVVPNADSVMLDDHLLDIG